MGWLFKTWGSSRKRFLNLFYSRDLQNTEDNHPLKQTNKYKNHSTLKDLLYLFTAPKVPNTKTIYLSLLKLYTFKK